MEIWIIGGIIVLLMVIVSTRIKRSAAKAFEAEEIETDEFIVAKPEGFLHPLREPPDFPFEVYSKLYGEKGTRNIWRARVRLRVSEGNAKDDILNSAGESEEIVEIQEVPGTESRGSVMALSRKTDDETEYVIRRKIVESDSRGKTFELRATTLVPYDEEYSDRLEALLDSFRVK